VRDPDFDYDSIYFWNCKHRYTFNYPSAWSNKWLTSDTNVGILYGDRIQVWAEAVPISASTTLQDFAEQRANKIEGVETQKEAVDWGNGVTVLWSTFANPNSTVIWWISESGSGMEVKALGPGYDDNFYDIQWFLATVVPNSPYLEDKCGSASSSLAPAKTTAPKATTQSCSFPNGDIEYWWNTVSQSVRDCYTAKYGDPGL